MARIAVREVGGENDLVLSGRVVAVVPGLPDIGGVSRLDGRGKDRGLGVGGPLPLIAEGAGGGGGAHDPPALHIFRGVLDGFRYDEAPEALEVSGVLGGQNKAFHGIAISFRRYFVLRPAIPWAAAS